MALPSPPKKPSADPPPPHSAADSLSPLIQATYQSPNLNFYLNGRKVILSNPNPHWTLLDYIRAQHGLKGTKLGCGEGGCGACTVVLQTKDAREKRKVSHLAVNACLFPLVGADGKHVITIEGIGSVSNPHPLQERIAKLHGSQCGFCTPGIVMSLYALIRNSYDANTKLFHLSASDIELKGHLDGNLCRCTGYKPILQAAKTFITEDLQGHLTEDYEDCGTSDLQAKLLDVVQDSCGSRSAGSCGRPGGCCRDTPSNSSSTPDSKSATGSPSTEPSSISETYTDTAKSEFLNRTSICTSLAPPTSFAEG